MTLSTLFVNLALKSTLVLVVAGLIALAMRRRSAASRHIVWTAAFATLLALPLLTLSLPSWPSRFANGVLRGEPSVQFRASAVATALGASTVVRQSNGAQSVPSPAPRIPLDIRVLLLWIYGAGVVVSLANLVRAYFSIARLRRGLPESPYTATDFGIAEPVQLLETDSGMPMAAGILRPVIFLPAESADWNRDRVRVVVLHEYAHVVRGDAAAQLLARLALSLNWFHPLAWFGWREFLKERERAADDLVLTGGALPSDYAGHLLEIARTQQALPAPAAAGIAMARQSQLEGRLMAILDSNTKRGVTGRTALAASLLVALVLSTPLATVRAQSHAEQTPPPDVLSVIASANAQKNHDILEQTAVSYEKLRKFAEAQQLLEAALAIRQKEGNGPYAEGLVRLGELAQKRGSTADAIDLYTRAVEIGDMPQTYPALLNLGIIYSFQKKNPALARPYLERARNVGKTGNQIGTAMTWLALLDQADPDQQGQAEQLYRTAMSLEDANSPEQARTIELLARFLRAAGREGEAGPLETQAKAMRRKIAEQLSPVYVSTSISGVTKVGNGVTAPRLIYKVEPSYTEEARALKVAGTVLLKIVVDVDGIAKDVQVVSGQGMGLDEKAVEAVSAWRFKPASLQDGTLVPVQAQIEINFRLL